jgi:hypothetical protein
MIHESLLYINTHSLPELFTIKALTSRYSDCAINHHIDDEGITNIIFLANNPTISDALQQKCLSATSVEHACALAHITAITGYLSDLNFNLLNHHREALCISIEKLYLILECAININSLINLHISTSIHQQDPHQESKPASSSFKIQNNVNSISYCRYLQTKYWLAGGASICCALFGFYKLYKKYNSTKQIQRSIKKVRTH